MPPFPFPIALLALLKWGTTLYDTRVSLIVRLYGNRQLG